MTSGRPVFTIIVLGASGDLAKKKTFPALFGLFLHGHIAPTTRIVGYARTKMDRPDFLKRISQHIKNTTTPKVKTMLDQFLDQCTYVSGVYDQDSGFQALEQELQRVEKETKTHDRLFYMALPPSVFIPVANGLKKNCYTLKGINRLIVEKPFGMDLESSRTLSKALGALYREDEVWHFLHLALGSLPLFVLSLSPWFFPIAFLLCFSGITREKKRWGEDVRDRRAI
ncbi:MAG: glucose-6-phosphate-1-dehydrogenase-like protein [Linnemannia elongata]|nr:MAG: glucose-6-phosphate-1-dehydrogenase-like protein [Linnemannia elongata]